MIRGHPFPVDPDETLCGGEDAIGTEINGIAKDWVT